MATRRAPPGSTNLFMRNIHEYTIINLSLFTATARFQVKPVDFTGE
ncbi:MAG: hypothetical protein M1591_05065 [Deltaproteobacteria bacterium]|nr:hypothetical protein [Deltaproteobacteria bacterium]